MPFNLRQSVALPVRALTWIGGQGTRAVAALVFIGIAVPPLGELVKPFVTEAIFLLLCISFMRVDIGALRDHLRRPGIVIAATAWTTLAVPAAIRWFPGASAIRRHKLPIDGLNILILLVFVSAVMGNVAGSLFADPARMIGVTAFAFAIFFLLVGITALIFRGVGRERAL